MSNYKRILVAVDLNPDTDLILIKRAQEFAKNSGGTVFLVHAIEPLNSYGNAYAYPMMDNVELEISDEHRTQLIAEAKSLGIPTDNLFLAFGFPDKVVTEQAKELNADLIIVGSHSRHGLALLFSSNIADNITKHAPCDLLAVHLPE
jgi:universal stress protein A